MSDRDVSVEAATSDEESEENTPRPDQQRIIDSDDYPMRVLAGAGTGKTFTMVRKIERLVEDGTPPDRILALTFTNNAADSMREKLVEKLGSRGHDIEAYTYHAICHELLQEFAYHADLDPRYDIATEADQFAIVYDVLDEMPYRFTKPEVFDPDGYGKGAAKRLLRFIPAMKRSGIFPEELEAYLGEPADLLALDELIERIEAAAEEHVKVSWRRPTHDRLDEMCDGLDALKQAIATERESLETDGVAADVRSFCSELEATCDRLATLLTDRADEIVDGDLEPAFKLPAYLFGAYSSPPKGIPKVGFTLTGKLQSFIGNCQVASDLTAGYAAYERRLSEETLLDFDDLVVRANALLEDEAVREWITSQWDYVFCDEYQDTDTVQFELVQQFVTEDRLFVVGDDDQAIYEWRGANIENIGSRLSAAFDDLTDETLEENFRSRQPILDLANEALEHLDSRGSTKELEAIGEKREATTGVVTIDRAEEPADEAQQITNAITRLLAGESELADEEYSAGDVAILVRKNTHAQPIVRSLERAGIPYELAGDLADESIGVRTVLAYLKALADPTDEISLNRVLTMRYRLHETDVARLNATDEPLLEELQSTPPERFREPERVEAARDDFTQLLDLRDTYSLTRLYRELKDVTSVEWFLSEQERRDLAQLDELIASFDDGAIEPELSREFVDFLRLHGEITESAAASSEDQPDTEDSAVDVMTIHKSKGLDFPVVVLPQLTADEWSPNERPYDTLEHVLSGGSVLDTDFARRDEHETRRVFHVALTRAEELSILVGGSDERTEDDGENLPDSVVEAGLPESIPWEVGGVEFPIWELIQSCLPADFDDGTETLATPMDTTGVVTGTHDGDALARGPARKRVLSLARSLLDGDLDAVDPTTVGIPVEALDPLDTPRLRRRHSYTSLDTLSRCERKHYLDHVLWAFDDPAGVDAGERTTGGTSSDAPSVREIGVLFHETAERAAIRGAASPTEWIEIASQLAATRGLNHALDDAVDCIERYFECEASEWEVVAAERAFALELDGFAVTGVIDAVCRSPTGELVILDYKATTKKRSLAEDLQLPLYVLACEELFDEPIRQAGYAYVGEVGPAVETRSFTAEDVETSETRLVEQLRAADTSSFEEYTPGEHCRWCPHRSLPCAEEAESN
ncbi:ATP-dependent helicase [Halomarina oriensis]|uniref:DNA 3'-5' helicase n=1 Tax=Halomarina oriensis TaxID=671145 RepID=A0A6B0GS83_9EURY|nr:ATP-dependent DNA helicase [Halomarina oriensis]MWG34538.1 AAA family ATPase [Halomarina oriensis]